MNRVEVEPALLVWARERAGRDVNYLLTRFPKLKAWERREALPTLKQLEAFAKATRTPIGYLFLSRPPVDQLPVTDLRTMRDVELSRPSPDLLDILYLCQQRQDWYRNEARTADEAPLKFVGSLETTDDITFSAARLRDALEFDVERRRQSPTWEEALRQFIEQADRLGILVMVSGVVGSNTRRRLDRSLRSVSTTSVGFSIAGCRMIFPAKKTIERLLPLPWVVPHYPDPLVSFGRRREDCAFNRLVDHVILVVGSNFLHDVGPIILKHHEMTDQVEQPLFLEYPRDQHLHLR